MNQLLEWLSRIFSSWKFWVIVPPWDIGVRVRMGRRAVELSPGPHFRIPFLDEIAIVNTRLRVQTIPPVTLAAGTSKIRIVKAIVGYRITDPVIAMLRYENPGLAVVAYAQAEVTHLRPTNEYREKLSAAFEGCGIEIEFVRYVEDVEIRALRIMNESWSVSDGAYQTNPSNGANIPGTTRY